MYKYENIGKEYLTNVFEFYCIAQFGILVAINNSGFTTTQ
jgi:hypothetical protein